MDFKKILALTIIVLAVFSCLSVASAGLFDFLGGDQAKNKTVEFEGFSLSLPDNAVMINNTTKDNGVTFNQHVLQYNNGKGDTYLLVLKANGSGMVNSISSARITISRGKSMAASTAEPSEITISVMALVMAPHGFLSSRKPKSAARSTHGKIKANFQVTRVNKRTQTTITGMKMMPAEVGLPFALFPSTANALPPSVGRCPFSL